MDLRRSHRAVAIVAMLLGVAACVSTPPVPTPVAPIPSAVTPAASASGTPSPSPGAPSGSARPQQPLASEGTIALLGNDGSLALVATDGTGSVLASSAEGIFAFPAWSPDGSLVAGIRYGSSEATILIFDALQADAEPVEIFRSGTISPFYLSWTPDGRHVSFLASEAGALALRIAPADGSAPLDGSGPGATIRSGNPLYFDWIERDRLLAHVGTGTGAFLGEMGLDGGPAAPALRAPGDFRSAVVSPDRRFVGYVRMGSDGSPEVVVAARDGSSEYTMPVSGAAAVGFDPVGDTIASIGPVGHGPSSMTIPLGPLRLIDGQTGETSTLLDGDVVSFWWSPDGATIAALRVQPVDGTASGSPGPSPSTSQTEVRLLFVDVASGEIGAQAAVQPGQLFIDQLLVYFDQYALSHRLWAPDSSSFLLPVVGADGATRVAVMYRNGDPIQVIDGAIGFWSP